MEDSEDDERTSDSQGSEAAPSGEEESEVSPAASPQAEVGPEAERTKRRKVWQKIGRPNKEIPAAEQTAVFGEKTGRKRPQRYPKQVERVINKQLDKPIAGPATIALLDSRGKIITELDVREMGASVLRHFGGYEGLGKLIKFQHDNSAAGSPTRTKTLELVTKLIEKAAVADKENDLSKQGLKTLGQRAAVLVDVIKRLGGDQLLIEAFKGAPNGDQ